MKQFRYILPLFLLLCFTSPAISQCSMCRAVSSSGAEAQEKRVGRGLNNGILYLLAMPYILGGVAYVIYRKNRHKKTEA